MRRHLIAAAGGAVAAVMLAVSMPAAQIASFQPLPLRQFLEENGWVPLPLPDKRMGPGSVVRITSGGDGAVTLRWLGDLRRCGITDRDFRYVRGKYPAIGVGDSFAIKAAVAMGYIARLQGTLDADKAGGAIMQIEGSGGDGVDAEALRRWLARTGASRRMSRVCNDFFSQDDAFLVSEAFRVSRASYGLVDKDGAKLAITGGAFGEPGSRSSSTLSVADDVYFAVRHVRRLGPDFFEPGSAPGAPANVPEADDLLRRRLEPGAGDGTPAK